MSKLKIDKWKIYEMERCFQNPAYFIETYVKLRTPYGIRDFVLSREQKIHLSNIIRSNHYELGSERLKGKTSLILAYTLWRVIFDFNYTTIICFNNRNLANHNRSNFEFMFGSLPSWMKADVHTNNKQEFKLDTGSKVLFTTPAIDAFRGMTINLLILEDQETFSENFRKYLSGCVYPVLKSGDWSKIITTESY